MNVLDLFSGIGGFSLGLERAGFKTVAFCEIEPYPRAVLRKHWPDVPIYDDVRTLTGERLSADGIAVDVICGGFPCQDISIAGKRVGIDGDRSGLWSEYARLIGELRPRYVIVENVAALLTRGLDRVLADLATLGYDAEWHCIPASAVGAPHQRDRIWIVAYPMREGRWQQSFAKSEREATAEPSTNGTPKSMADTYSHNVDGRRCDVQMGWLTITRAIKAIGFGEGIQWAVEPDVGRVANGIPARVDRLCGLGNAVVPQIPEIIGRAIMRAEGLRT